MTRNDEERSAATSYALDEFAWLVGGGWWVPAAAEAVGLTLTAIERAARRRGRMTIAAQASRYIREFREAA